MEVAEARGDAPFDAIPGPYGAHNWHPMSYNPQTGLVYLPAQEVPFNYSTDKDWKFVPGAWNIAVDVVKNSPPDDKAAFKAAGGYKYPKSQTPWQEIQRKIVDELSEGMVLKPAVKYQKIHKKFGIPRDNH